MPLHFHLLRKILFLWGIIWSIKMTQMNQQFSICGYRNLCWWYGVFPKRTPIQQKTLKIMVVNAPKSETISTSYINSLYNIENYNFFSNNTLQNKPRYILSKIFHIPLVIFLVLKKQGNNFVRTPYQSTVHTCMNNASA